MTFEHRWELICELCGHEQSFTSKEARRMWRLAHRRKKGHTQFIEWEANVAEEE